MKEINPTLNLSAIINVLPGANAGEMLSGTLSFTSMNAFDPVELIHQIPVLFSLYKEKKQLETDFENDAKVETYLL